MTTRTSWTIRYLAWSLPVLLCLAIAWRWFHPTVIPERSYTSQLRTVGVVLKLYADDHQGTLPPSLEDTMPLYVTNHKIFEGVQYVAPGAKLPELSPQTVIARKPYPEDHLVGELHADMRAEAHKP